VNYDLFQKRAIDYIREGCSVIVSAPTGAGKTAIAEYIIRGSIKNGTKVVYTAPIKALSNQKFRDFYEGFGDKIGLLTGDVSINSHAPVLIMTTEIFRNKLLEERSDLGDYSWVIFDEVHYIDDYERGSTWEESLIFLPEHMNMLALSATIPNIEELAEWFHSIHKRPFKVVTENSRPVPLHFFYQYEGRIFDDMQKLQRMPALSVSWDFARSDRRHKTRPNRPTALIKHLYENDRLPCIYFSFGRRRCEYLAEEMRDFCFVNNKQRQNLKLVYQDLCSRFGLLGEKSAVVLEPLVERGIAYHHAGMLPRLKEVIERLFTNRLIKVIFTTETFALGVNMPARTVVFDELRKYYGRFFSALRTRDFYQMAGRAGRRGIDEEGFVYSRINPRHMSFQELKNIIYGRPEMVKSRFNASYATVLNLYEKYKETLYDIYPRSFHYHQRKERFRRKALELLRSKVMILKELRYIKDGHLTDKGRFAGRIYGYELSLGELYEKGMLEGLSETELGILCLALVYEPRKGSHKPRLSRKTRRLCAATEDIVHHVRLKEKRYAITPLSKRYCYHLSPCLEAWMNKEKFDNILHHTNADEGEVIRFFRMSLQILREMLDTSIPHILKEKTRKTISYINRGIINAERQLRQ